MKPAVFLDRDGVLVEDRGVYERGAILEGVQEALAALKDAGYLLITVSNQSRVARGLATEAQIVEEQREIERALVASGGPILDAFYYCPHHPHASEPAYRCHCDCRKPSPGMILDACRTWQISPQARYMVGDRPSDVLAGARAGCRTIWMQTGRHVDAPIVGMSDDLPTADLTCTHLGAAASWILERSP